MEQKRNLLVVRLKSGDHRAAAELVDVYYQQIYLFFRRLGHNCQTSEDLTQECFLHAWSHIGQLREANALSSWLYRIAANLSGLYWRRNKDKNTTSFEKVDAFIAEYDKMGHLEQLGRLRNAVAALPMKLRQAIVLHYMQQLTIAESAEAADVRLGTLKSRLSRALKVLRKQIT